MTAVTFVPSIFAGHQDRSTARTLLLAVGITFLTAVGAHARIYLPFTPVPITMQTMAVMLAGLVLAPWAALLSQALYVMAGLSGLPFLAAAGTGTVGYLAGFVVAAPLISMIASRGHAVAACAAGTAVIHILGCLGLAATGFPVGLPLFVAGSLPFLPGDVFKAAAALKISRAA